MFSVLFSARSDVYSELDVVLRLIYYRHTYSPRWSPNISFHFLVLLCDRFVYSTIFYTALNGRLIFINIDFKKAILWKAKRLFCSLKDNRNRQHDHQVNWKGRLWLENKPNFKVLSTFCLSDPEFLTCALCSWQWTLPYWAGVRKAGFYRISLKWLPLIFSAQVHPTGHAVIRTILHSSGLDQGAGEPCCVPVKLKGISVFVEKSPGAITLRSFQGMVVEECGCRWQA